MSGAAQTARAEAAIWLACRKLWHFCSARQAAGQLVRAGGEQWCLKREIRLCRAIGQHQPVLDALWRSAG